MYQPPNNIYVHAGDTIYVYTEPQTFSAFGATIGAVLAVARGGAAGSQLKFDAWRVTLAEAFAKAGGLNKSLPNQHRYFFIEESPAKLLSALESTAQSLTDRSFRSSTT